MTGGDAIRARFLYGKEFEFKPVAKFFFATNTVPNIYESTDAIWDRVHLIPFNYRVPEDKIDKLLGLKIRSELDAIFTEAVKYCSTWQAYGNLVPPDKVKAKVINLRQDMDMFGQFIYECCETNAECETAHKELYHGFFSWSKDQGFQRPPSSKALSSYLREKLYVDFRGTDHVKFWSGIRLKPGMNTQGKWLENEKKS
jgi:putative DNA primase/helicase